MREGVAPADFPPPVDTRREFIRRDLDAEEDRVEVGVAIVGGGTAGLACANRLLELLAHDPATAERLGEVPVAVIEKGRVCGAHSLSGAVMRPGPLLELFPDLPREQWRSEGFAFGEVTREAVYLLPSRRVKVRIPTPPPFRNHGAEVISVAALARYQQQRAEDAGAMVATETSAVQLIVRDGCVAGVRTGDKGRGRDGEPLPTFEPGTDIAAQATVLAEGSGGHLTGAAIGEFGLADDREPQVWELGVKEIWRVPRPLERVIHTVGPWPLKLSARYGQVGGGWIYPMRDERTGEHLVSLGFVVDLEYADATTSPHDLLQLFKTHPLVRDVLDGGDRLEWGAKALPGSGDCWGRGRHGRHRRPQGRPPRHHHRAPRRRGDPCCAGSLEQHVRSVRTLARAVRERDRALPGAQRPPAPPARSHPRRAAGQPRDRDPRPAAPRPPTVAARRRAAHVRR
jgi:electron-transferring-flavoprotein dehydrogenase